jgi:hypothetical protein
LSAFQSKDATGCVENVFFCSSCVTPITPLSWPSFSLIARCDG